MKIAVVGTGYVGLVTGVCFATKDNQVICVDNDPEKLKKLKSGINTIWEPRLEELLQETIKKETINFTDDLKKAVKESDVVFLCLPTPPKEDGSADLKYVLEVAEEIGGYIDSFKVIVNKSTVPVGTGDRVKEALKKSGADNFAVASNPEFLREGNAIGDFLEPERVVIGIDSEKAKEMLVGLYRPFVEREEQIISMNIKSSEMTKYAANSFLATKISFINEIADLCDKVGANVEMIANGIGADSRIGKSFLKAGIGYGGSCFPKDVSALFKTGFQYNYTLEILDSVMKVNKQQKDIFVKKVCDYFDNNLEDKKLAIWGLSFKPDTDDIREAPSIYIIKHLQGMGAEIVGYDPVATKNFQRYSDLKIDYSEDKYSALENADALLVLTEWKEFTEVDLLKIKELLKKPVVFDGRNIYDPRKMKDLEIDYFSVGRP